MNCSRSSVLLKTRTWLHTNGLWPTWVASLENSSFLYIFSSILFTSLLHKIFYLRTNEILLYMITSPLLFCHGSQIFISRLKGLGIKRNMVHGSRIHRFLIWDFHKISKEFEVSDFSKVSSFWLFLLRKERGIHDFS